MKRKHFRKMESEIELDLAPLLAVMVKLVPVLLISSAFVQVGVIETELPQVVKESIQDNKDQPDKRIELVLKENGSIEISRSANGALENFSLPPSASGDFDLALVRQKLLELKEKDTTLFSVELKPEAKVSYSKIVKIMDTIRKSPNGTKFTVPGKSGAAPFETDLMFPDVVFANLFSKG